MTEERDRGPGADENQAPLDPFGDGDRRRPRRDPPPRDRDDDIIDPFEDGDRRRPRRERPPRDRDDDIIDPFEGERRPDRRRQRRRPPQRERGHHKGGGEAKGGGLQGEREGVRYDLEVEGVEGRWEVEAVDLHEGLNELYALSVRARLHGAHLTEAELRLHEASLHIEREGVDRSVRGLIRAAHVEEAQGSALVTLEIAPAAWLYTHDRDTRIFQQISIPALVERLYEELLGPRRRELRLELSAEYPVYEYLVQYEEPSFCFLERLLEEAGIAYSFEHHEAERELLILSDDNRSRPLALTERDGELSLVSTEASGQEHEAVIAARRQESIGATGAVTGGFDFSNPAMQVRAERRGQARQGQSPEPSLELEVYEHEGAARYHGYQGRQYHGHDADRRAQHRVERLELARQGWTMRATALGLVAGSRFALREAGELDGDYLIVALSGRGEADPEAPGTYECTLTCVPVDLPYRPARRSPRPRALGPETATVVGPEGEEIHVDEHGRIKVQFHWDREGQRDERSSTWIRVAQSWAGAGWGTMFIPRIGMEVVVSFLRGDPDRPMVTGCVYNGQNPTPYALPEDKTKSTIKTSSSPGGEGFNELRFEDKRGREEIFLHAEKDLNEIVKNRHSTYVGADQSNIVRRDQSEVVHRDQALTVERDRGKTVVGNETTHVQGRRYEKVTGFDHIVLEDSRKTEITEHEHLIVGKSRSVSVSESDTEVYGGGRSTTVRRHDVLVVEGANRSTQIGGQYSITSEGQYAVRQAGTERLVLDGRGFWESAHKIQLHTPGATVEVKESGEIVLSCGSKISLLCGESGIELAADGAVTIKGRTLRFEGGPSAVDLGSEGATMSGPKVTTASEGFNVVQGMLVRIN